MNYIIKYMALFFILFSSISCFAQDKDADTYQVGFKYYKTYDKSRRYVVNDDTIFRPLLIHFWYPSNEKNQKDNYRFKNYIDLISLREDFNKPSSEVEANSSNFINAYAGFAKQYFGVDTSLTTEKILACSVAAKYGIAIAKSSEKFPLVIYAPSNSKSAVQNHMICEYLAGHGFMVIAVGSAGDNSLNRKNDEESIMAQVNDMEYMLNYVEDSLKIKYSDLGLMGFSTGSLANIIFQMKNENVKAVLSMDGSQEYGHYNILFNAEIFNLKKTNVPYCFLVNNYENFSIYPFYNSIVSKEKQIFRMPYLDHNGFVSFWRFFDLCSAQNSTSKFCLSYDYICSAALTFFNAYLKPDYEEHRKSELHFQNNEYINSITIDNSMTSQLGNIILSDGMVAANDFLNRNEKLFSKKENEIIILSRMFRDPDVDAAIQLLLFNVKMLPNSWQTQYELGHTYKLNQEPALAKEHLLKAQELNPENIEIIKMLNEINEPEK